MKVLVTGGAGFIGSNLVEELVARGNFDVVVLDDLSTGLEQNLANVIKDIHFIQGSLLDDDQMDRAIEGVEAIVHLAAVPSVPRSIRDPLTSHRVNVDGTVALLERARVQDDIHVIYSSSSSVYGANRDLPKAETGFTRPLSPYAASKLAAENYLMAYAESYGLRSLAFRFFNVYGPMQRAGHAYAAAIPAFLSAALTDEPVTVFGDGNQTRDFTYVGTVVQILVRALEAGTVSESPVNLAFGYRTSLLQLIRLIEELLGSELEVRHVAERPGDVRDSQADNSLLRSLFTDVTPIELREGLGVSIDWYKGVIGPSDLVNP